MKKKMRASFEGDRKDAKKLQKIVNKEFSDEKLFELFCDEISKCVENDYEIIL